MDAEKKQRYRIILAAEERIKCEVFLLEDPSRKEISFEQALEILEAEKKLETLCRELVSNLNKNYNSIALDMVLTRVHKQLPQK